MNGERYGDRSSSDYCNFYRGLLTDEVNASIAGAHDRTYRMTSSSARQIGYLLDAIEHVVLK